MKRLGLLETDILEADLAADFRSYGHMFARYFNRLGGGNHPRPLRAGYNPSSAQIASTRALTAASMAIGRPHSRVVSPGHL